MSQPAPTLNPNPRGRANIFILRWLDRATYTSAIGGALCMVLLLLMFLAIVAHGAMPSIREFGLGFLTSTNWAANPPVQEGDTGTISLSIADAHTFHRGEGSFIKDGFASGYTVKAKGFANAGNNSTQFNMTVTAVTENDLTVAQTLVEEAPGAARMISYYYRDQPSFGARPLIVGTLLTSFIAIVISVPISIGCAVFLTKLAPKLRILVPRLRPVNGRHFKRISLRHGVTVVSFMIELLAAIPSVAYGLWGFAVLVPINQRFLQPFMASTADLNRLWSALPHWRFGLHMSHWPVIGPAFANHGYGTNMFTSGLILSIMVTPIITAIVRDVLTVAPVELEHGALGLGATWWQATRLLLGFSKMGILGAVILGFARAIGETMAVTLVIGNNASDDASIFSTGHSIASKLAVQFANADTEAEVHALIYAAFILLVITTLINGIARVMIMRVASRRPSAPDPKGVTLRILTLIGMKS